VVLQTLIKSLDYIQMEQLKAENLNYLMQALHLLHPLPTLPEE